MPKKKKEEHINIPSFTVTGNYVYHDDIDGILPGKIFEPTLLSILYRFISKGLGEVDEKDTARIRERAIIQECLGKVKSNVIDALTDIETGKDSYRFQRNLERAKSFIVDHFNMLEDEGEGKELRKELAKILELTGTPIVKDFKQGSQELDEKKTNDNGPKTKANHVLSVILRNYSGPNIPKNEKWGVSSIKNRLRGKYTPTSGYNVSVDSFNPRMFDPGLFKKVMGMEHSILQSIVMNSKSDNSDVP